MSLPASVASRGRDAQHQVVSSFGQRNRNVTRTDPDGMETQLLILPFFLVLGDIFSELCSDRLSEQDWTPPVPKRMIRLGRIKKPILPGLNAQFFGPGIEFRVSRRRRRRCLERNRFSH